VTAGAFVGVVADERGLGDRRVDAAIDPASSKASITRAYFDALLAQN